MGGRAYEKNSDLDTGNVNFESEDIGFENVIYVHSDYTSNDFHYFLNYYHSSDVNQTSFEFGVTNRTDKYYG